MVIYPEQNSGSGARLLLWDAWASVDFIEGTVDEKILSM